jgi:hypothetical protein
MYHIDIYIKYMLIFLFVFSYDFKANEFVLDLLPKS